MGKSTSISLGLCVLVILSGLWTPAYSDDKCSIGCKGSSGSPAFLNGHKYSYSVDGDVTVYLTGANKQETGVKLSGQVTVTSLGNCAHVLRVQNLVITGPGGKKYGKPPGIEKPVRFVLEDGALSSDICIEEGDTRRSLNIKRAIISLLQNEHKQTSEVDVFGVCPTEISSSQEGAARLVHRNRDLSRCAHREQGGKSIVSAIYNPTAEIKNTQVLQSRLTVESKVNNGIPEKVAATEEYLYKPFSVGQNGARAIVHTKLNLVGNTAGSDTGKFTEVRSIIFENPHGIANEKSNFQSALQAVKDTSKTLQTHASFKSAGTFAQLVRIFRITNKEDLLKVYGQIKGHELEKRVFLDGLLRAGTGYSIEASVQLLKSKELSPLEQSLVYLSLGNAKHVTNDAIKAATSLLDIPNIPKEVYLGVGALAGAYCREHKCHGSTSQSQGIAALSQKLASKLNNCKPRSKVEEDYVVAVLKGIRSIRHIEDCLIEKLVHCVADDSVKPRVRVAALEAYHADPCTPKLKSTALDILKNIKLDSEIRIQAYLAVIECPCGKSANEIKTLLEKEPSLQVGRYIASSLRHIKSSANPDKQHAREHYGQIRTPNKYNIDDRKYSFYRELSYNIDALGTGGSLEQSVIYSQDSFLPRSASLNLTAEVFGHSLNVFEVGGRQGNLDKVIEHFLGPKGYFRRHKPQEIYDDLLKRVDEVEKKVEGKLRGRRALKQDIDNFDKQIKDESVPYNNELDLDIYVKLFGTDAVFLSLGDDKGFNLDTLLDPVLKQVETGINQAKHFRKELRAHLLFLDAELAYPTLAGFPLKLNLFGSATGRLDVSTSIDARQIFRDPHNAKIDIKVVPSTDIEVSGLLLVDADVVSTGLKVTVNLHSSTGGHIIAKVLENGKGFDLQFVLPVKTQEIVTASNDLVYVTIEKGQPETTIALKVDTDRKEYSGCFDQLSGVIGLTLCGEVSVPFSVSGPDAQASIQKYLARYPLTGPSKIKVHLEENDLRGYHIKGVLRNENPQRQSFELLLEAEGSKNRKTSITGELVDTDNEKTVKLSLESPIKNLYGEVSLIRKPSEFSGLVKAKIDNDLYYGRLGVTVQGNDQRSVYKPLIEYEIPDGQGKKTLNVEGQVVKQTAGTSTKYSLEGIKINLPQGENVLVEGHAITDRVGLEGDVKVKKGDQSLNLVGSLKGHDAHVKFQNTLNPYLNFDCKVHSENVDKHYQNDIELSYGPDLNSKDSKVIVNQLLKYQQTGQNEYNVLTKNKVSINAIPLVAKVFAEVDGKKVDVELEGTYGKNKAEFDLEARTHIKSPGDYSVKLDASLNDKGIEAFAKRDIVSADKSNFENYFEIKKLVKYELSGVVLHKNKPNDVNIGAVGHLKVTSRGKSDDIKFDIGLQENQNLYSSHAKLTKGNDELINYLLKINLGANSHGELKVVVKGTISCNGQYKITDSDGSGNGLILIQFVKSGQKIKGEGKFKAKAPVYSADVDLYLNFEKDNNDKLHFSTNSKCSDKLVDSKNKLVYAGKSTELNLYHEGVPNTDNGVYKGKVEIVLPNERVLGFRLEREISTKNDVINDDVDLEISDTPKRGATPSKFIYGGKFTDTNYEADTIKYDAQISVHLKDGRILENALYFKNIPVGDNKYKFDFKSIVSGNLIPKIASLAVSADYSDPDNLLTFTSKYKIKGSYGDDIGIEFDGNEELNILENSDKKYFEQGNLKLNLPFEQAHDIKFVYSELILLPENKDVLFEETGSASFQINSAVYRFDSNTKIEKSSGFSKIKIVVPHTEPFALETSYKGNFEGEKKHGEVAIKTTYGKGKSAQINIEAARLSDQDYTLLIKANAPKAEKLKKLEIRLHSKSPSPDTYGSNLIVDVDNRVYKADYLIVYSKANPALDIKFSVPEAPKTSRFYLKGSNLSSNQGKLDFKLENIKDLSIDANSEYVIQKDAISYKIHANSEKLKLKNYYSEISTKDTPSGKRLEFQAKNDNVNIVSGSTSFISKQEGTKTIVEGSGSVKVRNEDKSVTFKYIRDVLAEGPEQGIETFVNMAIGDRSYVAESRVTNLEYKYSYVYCEEKKQCAHVEFNSKINVQTPGLFQHNVNVVVDLRKLGFSPEFGLQYVNELSEHHLPQYTFDVHLNKDDKKYHLHVYSTPKEGQLPSGITITLPHRVIALEALGTYRTGKSLLPLPLKGEINFYLDKNKPQQKASIRALLDVTTSGNQKSAVAEFAFNHPKLGKEVLLKYRGHVQHPSDYNYKYESTTTFSHPRFGNDRSCKVLFEVTPRTFKFLVDNPLVKLIDVDASATVNENVQEGQIKFCLLQGKSVLVRAIAKEYKYFEFTTGYSDDTERKLSVIGHIEPEKRVDISADIVLPGEKKNIAHGAIFIQDNLVKTDYGASKDNYIYFVNALKKDLSSLEGRIGQLGEKARDDFKTSLEKAAELAKQVEQSYGAEIQKIEKELVNDKTLQEIDKALHDIVQYVAGFLSEIIQVTEKIVSNINSVIQETIKKIDELYQKQLAPQVKQLYANIAAIVREYSEGLIDVVAHFSALVADFFDKHKAELQELTNALAEIFKDLTRIFVSRLKEIRRIVTQVLADVTQQIKELPIIAAIKEKIEEFAVPEQILNILHEIHQTIRVVLPTEETKQLADAICSYVQKKLKQEKVDDNTELRVIYEKFAVALTSVVKYVRQQFNDLGLPAFTLNYYQFGFATGESAPSLGGTASFSLLNQFFTGELPSALDFIRAYRPRYINPLDEVPSKLRAVVVNGQHIFTFDGRHLTFPGSCRYVLAHDFVDRNFTLALQLQNGLPKALSLEDKSGSIVELRENGQVAYNGAVHGFPVIEKDIFAFRETNGRIGLGTKYGLLAICAPKLTVCYIEVSGYYFAKLRGLLGDANNEPYTDFRLPNGQIASSEADFGNAYRLSGSCPQVKTPDHSHHHLTSLPAACEQVFGSSSPLRPLALLLDVNPFKQACSHACTANPKHALQEACDIARGYTALAVTGLLPAVLPPACLRCTDADKPRNFKEEYTFELPAKQADIVVAVETVQQNEQTYKDLVVPLVSQVVDTLKSKHVTDIKVYLVGITPKYPYPLVYDADNKLKGAKIKFDDESRYNRNYLPVQTGSPSLDKYEIHANALYRNLITLFGASNVIRSYNSLLDLPLRAGAVKTTISVVGERCEKPLFFVDALRYAAYVPLFKLNAHTQNIISPLADLRLTDGKNPNQVIAYDDDSVILIGDKKHGKDTQEVRRGLYNPPDACVDFIEANNGLVISSTTFQANGGQQKQFIQAAGLAIVDKLLEFKLTQECQCLYDDSFTARSVCVPISYKQIAHRRK